MLPLAITRPVADFRFGILTIREKWEKLLPGDYSYLTAEYLKEKYPVKITDDNIFIGANICPSLMLSAEIANLKPGESLKKDGMLIACRGEMQQFNELAFSNEIQTETDLLFFEKIYNLFIFNDRAIEEDFKLITDGRESRKLPDSVRVIGDMFYEDGTPKIFIEEGVNIE